MKTRLLDLWRRFVHHLPEVLLVFFVLSLMPAVVLLVLEAKMQVAKMWALPAAYWESTVNNPWPAAAVLVCAAGTLLILLVLWRNWIFIWAVARKMIIEAFHRKVVLVLLVFLLLMLLLPLMLETEGSLKSDVQLVLLYSLVLAMVLLSLMAIFMSAASICSEVERKQVQVTDTKPLRRWQFLFGKWFGAVVMCTAVLFVMSTATCGLVLWLARERDYDRMTPGDEAKARKDYEELQEEVFVARKSVKAFEPPGIDAWVEKRMKEMQAEGQLPASPKVRRRLREQVRTSVLHGAMSVMPGGHYTWQFAGLTPGQEGTLFVRFKAYASVGTNMLVGRWVVLRRELFQDEAGKAEYRLVPLHVVLPPSPEGWYAAYTRQFTIPASLVGSDGTLFLDYMNLDTRAFAMFDSEQFVEIMQREGGFLSNYYRALLILICHIALLAALGLMAGSVFSFPVASLTVMFFFTVGLVGPWFVGFLEPGLMRDYTVAEEIVETAWSALLRVVLAVMPHFGAFNPLGSLTDGVLVSWGLVARAAAMMVYIKGCAALLVGMYFYARRELARVIV